MTAEAVSYHPAESCPLRNAAYVYVNACTGKIVEAKDTSIIHVFDYLPEQLIGLSVSVLFRHSDQVEQSLHHCHSSSVCHRTPHQHELEWSHWSHSVASLMYPSRTVTPRIYPTQHHIMQGQTQQGHPVWLDVCIHIPSYSSSGTLISLWLLRHVTEHVVYSHVSMGPPLFKPLSHVSFGVNPIHLTTVMSVNRYGIIDHVFPPAFLDYSYQDLISQSMMKYVHNKDIHRYIQGMDRIFRNKSSTFSVRWALNTLRFIPSRTWMPSNISDDDLVIKRTSSQFSQASINSVTSESAMEELCYPKLRTDSFTYYYSDEEEEEEEEDRIDSCFVWVEISGKLSDSCQSPELDNNNMSGCPSLLLLSLRTLDTTKALAHVSLDSQDPGSQHPNAVTLTQTSSLIQPLKIGWSHLISLLDQALEWLEAHFIHLCALFNMMMSECKTLPSNKVKQENETTRSPLPTLIHTTLEKVGSLVMGNALFKSLFDMALSHGLVPRMACAALNLN